MNGSPDSDQVDDETKVCLFKQYRDDLETCLVINSKSVLNCTKSGFNCTHSSYLSAVLAPYELDG